MAEDGFLYTNHGCILLEGAKSPISLNKLADSAKGVVSLRAQVDEHKVQTYRIKRDKAVENTGVNSRVEKYGLTYEKIKERFK